MLKVGQKITILYSDYYRHHYGIFEVLKDITNEVVVAAKKQIGKKFICNSLYSPTETDVLDQLVLNGYLMDINPSTKEILVEFSYTTDGKTHSVSGFKGFQ